MAIKGPLTGARILSFGSVHAGNYCAKILGDLGAEVLKIEAPGRGDMIRDLGPFASDPELGVGSYVVAMCRNMKSVALDLYTESGRQAFHDLVKASDVVFDNYRAGVMERVDADYDALRKINPRIISCSICGYGSSGPYSHRPSYDDLAEGLSGMSSLCGERTGGRPIRSPVAIADISAAMQAAIGIISALYQREHTGKGTRIAVNLLDVCMSIMDTHYATYYLTGKVPGPQGSKHPTTPLLGAFKCKDGYMVLGPSWPRICRVINREDLIDDPRFNSPAKRFENKEALEDALEQELEKYDREAILALFEVEDMAGGPLNNMEQALADPQVIHNRATITLEHPTYGKIQNIDNAIKVQGIEGTPTPPPLVGEHTEEVLKSILNYSDEQIRKLTEEAEKHSKELIELHARRLF
jgi:Predicted acyl-CoA transferases/carnitine dehydratase